MSRVRIALHDVTPAQYMALAIDEKENEGTRWKVLETPTVEVVVFAPRGLQVTVIDAEGSKPGWLYDDGHGDVVQVKD